MTVAGIANLRGMENILSIVASILAIIIILID